MIKILCIALLLCSFTVNAGEMLPNCGISHVLISPDPDFYEIYYYCIQEDGSATVDSEYADLVTINELFNGEWRSGLLLFDD